MAGTSWNFEDAVARVRVGGKSSGTAFRVSATFVLTCKHVVTTPGRDSPAQDIQLGFKATGRTLAASVVDQYWDNEHDIAVLQCQGMPREIEQVRLAPSQDTKGHGISSFGYPIDAQGTAGDGISAAGTITGHEGTGRIQISSGQVCPGFSGAPLYDQQLDRVTGMFSQVFETSQELSNRMAYEAFAIPVEFISGVVPELMVEPIDLDKKRREATKRLKAVVVERLSQAPRAVAFLAADRLASADGPDDEEPDDLEKHPDLASKVAGKVFDRLIERSIKDVLQLFVKGYKRLADVGDRTSAAALRDACECLIPASYDKDTVSQIHAAILNHNVFVQAPANVDTTIELIMASVDGRKIRFADLRQEFPEGDARVPASIELGIDDVRALETFENGILQVLRIPPIPGVPKKDQINRRLEQLFETENLRYYFVYSPDELAEHTVELLAKSYPRVVMTKKTAPTDPLAEGEILWLLRDIFAARGAT